MQFVLADRVRPLRAYPVPWTLYPGPSLCAVGANYHSPAVAGNLFVDGKPRANKKATG